MALALNSNAGALSNGLRMYFSAGGGTAPYSYAVVAGGVGGTINSSSGLYTAPSSGNGVATVRVTDALSATATAQVTVGGALELFLDIIRRELDLDNDQVFLWDQKYTVPKDSRLYVAIAQVSVKAFGNAQKLTSDGDEFLTANFASMLDVNIMSRSTDALFRKEEVVLALNSVYSQSQQEINSFYIAKIPTNFINLSNQDGAAIPYRFTISVAIQYATKKTKSAPYFDDFQNVDIEPEP